MSRTPLFDALREYSMRNRAYFRIPGHRFGRGVESGFINFAGRNIFSIDVTETPMTDDLHKPGGVIAESQRQTAEAFGADESFYLVNGTTCGNESMIIAAAREGEPILIPRNAHKSVMAALIISGAVPVYVPAAYMPQWGLHAHLDPDRLSSILKENQNCRAVFAVSPTYHGICSDLSAVASAAHGSGVPLLVDEAHGAHLYFSEQLPAGALRSGADACAQSMHKTCGSLTQSSLLHLKSALLDRGRLDSALRMTMSTSPSYILMSSLETARAGLEECGGEEWAGTAALAGFIRDGINRAGRFRCPSREDLKAAGAFDADPCRIIINCDGTGISGRDLKKHLWESYSVDTELADERNLLLLLAPGNSEAEAVLLLGALEETGKKHGSGNGFRGKTADLSKPAEPPIPPMVLRPREAWRAETVSLPWNEIRGRIAAESAAPYPPGIPVLYPGELITDEIHQYLSEMRAAGAHIHGPADPGLNAFRVCR